MVTDYSKINKFVKHPVHPFPSVADILRLIPAGTNFFTKMDAIHGYFKLALDKESLKLMTFLLPTGCYRYLRAPIRLGSSSDEWFHHSDRAIQGFPFTKKIVDDILVWASNLPELYDRKRLIARRCEELNIALSRKKNENGSKILFAGLLLTEKEVKPDPACVSALSDFPVPKEVTVVRSFLGLANQLSGFVPDFAHMTVNLRALTAKKNAFHWLPKHQDDFLKVKRLLTSDMVVTHFDPNLPVTVLTDASCLHGLGYSMGDLIDGKFKVVACGSKSLTPTQQRYANIELKCLAVHFTVDNCSFYLKGAPSFNVMTNHKPLEGIFRNNLFDIVNPTLQRIWENVIEYCFTVTWVHRKSHLIDDALSRNLRDYVKLCTDVRTGAFSSVYARQLKSVMPQLSVDEDLVYLDGSRIVLPFQATKKILPLLHVSHIRMNKTYDLCHSMYFWPGMFNNIKQMVSQCRPCNINRPSQPKNPRIIQPPSTFLVPPMGHVGLDLFEFGGKQHLVCVDQ